MTKAAQKLKSKLLELSERDRKELALMLLDSLDRLEPDGSEAWAREIDRRAKELRKDPSSGIPAEVSLARLRKKSRADESDEWAAELERRIKEADAGRMKERPSEEVFADLRRRRRREANRTRR